MKLHKAATFRRFGLVAAGLLAAATFLFTFGHFQPSRVHAQGTLGSPLPGLTPGQLNAFNIGFAQFNVTWDPVKGLGPVFTQNDCGTCHSTPVPGGTNATLRTTFFGKTNLDGTFNPLIEEGGFVLQNQTASKFIKGCPIPREHIPPDATIVAQRVPPDLFGLGLVDAIADQDIINNAVPKGLGIQGTVNTVPDWNGTMRPGRYGNKAQLASLVQAVGTAFLIDIGITNPVNLVEECSNGAPGSCTIPPNCLKAREPNDPNGKITIQIFDYVVFLAPNPPLGGHDRGQALFSSVGCDLCHIPSYTTQADVKVQTNFTGGTTQVVPALSNQPVNLYSDLLLHNLGPRLADGITLGQATGSLWRTTPLWGLSTRTVFLHDGRANTLNAAIQSHFSIGNSTYPDSEANQVITNFNALSPDDQAELIAFISSL
jgi:CxxC motif-containing protein (DUF1111 family)